MVTGILIFIFVVTGIGGSEDLLHPGQQSPGRELLEKPGSWREFWRGRLTERTGAWSPREVPRYDARAAIA